MTPDEIVTIIQNGNYHLLWLIVAIAALQFFSTHLIGERIKKSIEHEYKTNLEQYKNELLRQKLIYEQQLDAYKDFTSIMYLVYPEKNYPDMDWSDAVEQIASGFKEHHRKIKAFQQKQAAILPKQLKDKVDHCGYLCSDGQFEVIQFEVSREGYKMAEDLWNKLHEIENDFRELLKIDKPS